MNYYNQFILSKLSQEVSQRSRDYAIVARSAELNNSEVLRELYIKYKFWGAYQPSEPHRALGVFYYNNEFVLVQVTPPPEPCYSYFTPYRYVFIPVKSLEKLKYRIFKFYLKFFNEDIPAIHEISNNYQKLPIPFLDEEISQKEKREYANLIVNCLQETDNHGNPYLFSALAALINGKRIVINDKDNQDNQLLADLYYLICLFLLLPATCRIEIPIAVGNIEINQCAKWAKLLIKNINSESHIKPQNCIWLDRNSKRFVGVEDDKTLQSDYVDKLRQFIEKNKENPTKIQQLIEQLDEVTDTSITLKTVAQQPFQVINQLSILEDLRSLIYKALENGKNTKPLSNLVINNCDFQLENNTVLQQISLLNDQPDKCTFISILLQNKGKLTTILPEFNKLTQKQEGFTLSNIIQYTNDCPETWNNYQDLVEKLQNLNSSDKIKFLDSILGENPKFVINIICKFLNLITEKDIDKTYFENSKAWQKLLNTPENYLPQLVKDNNLKHESFIILVNYLLDAKKFDLIKGEIGDRLFKEGDTQTEFTEADRELINRLIKLDVELYLDQKHKLTPIVILLNPQVNLETNNISDQIKEIAKEINLNKDQVKLLQLKIKKITGEFNEPNQTQTLLDRCDLLGLEKNCQIEILREVNSNALNYQILSEYIDLKKMDFIKDQTIINLILNLNHFSDEKFDFPNFYKELFYHLFISYENLKSQSSDVNNIAKQIISKLNLINSDKNQFFNDIVVRIFEQHSVHSVNKLFSGNSSFVYYQDLKGNIIKEWRGLSLTQEIVKQENEKNQQKDDSLIDKLAEKINAFFENQLEQQINPNFEHLKTAIKEQNSDKIQNVLSKLDEIKSSIKKIENSQNSVSSPPSSPLKEENSDLSKGDGEPKPTQTTTEKLKEQSNQTNSETVLESSAESQQTNNNPKNQNQESTRLNNSNEKGQENSDEVKQNITELKEVLNSSNIDYNQVLEALIKLKESIETFEQKKKSIWFREYHVGNWIKKLLKSNTKQNE